MRTYELVVVYSPRVSDDDVSSLTGEVKQLLTAGGGVTITKTDTWGRRRLGYEIEKFTEGKYVVVYFASEDGAAPIPDVERRLMQNDNVLRFLTTRTDVDLKRAGLPIPTEVEPEVAEDAAEASDAEASTPVVAPEPQAGVAEAKAAAAAVAAVASGAKSSDEPADDSGEEE